MKAQKKAAAAVRIAELSKAVGTGDDAPEALLDLSFSVQPAELVVVKGSSAVGTSTLLNCIAGLEEPDSGSVFIAGRELTAMREWDRTAFRQTHLGLLFRSFGLIPFLTVAENVEVPMRLVGMQPAERQDRVNELLEFVGLAKHHHQRPAELSGGQQQRVGLARAVANRPKVLLADEPTGQLDSVAAGSVVDLINDLVHSHSIGAIVSTHDPVLIQRADRVLELHAGRIKAGSIGTASVASRPIKRASKLIEVPAEIAAHRRRETQR